MYCVCGKQLKVGYVGMPQPDGTFCYDWGVCANCHRPSKMKFEKVTFMYTPARAMFVQSAHGDGHGRSILRWNGINAAERFTTMVFHPYPRKVDMPDGKETDQGRTILVELWHWLDEEIDIIRGGLPPEVVEIEKARAVTLSETIALIMSPFYADTNAVLSESMVRWTARQGGSDHESPGLAETIWDPGSRFDGTPYSRENQARIEAGKAEPAVLDTAKQGFIKMQLDSGSFKPAELAKMFEVSEEVIKHNYDLVSG